MTFKHFVLAGILALAVQALVFAHRYEDLLFLRRPVDVVAVDSPGLFAAHARTALARDRLTRRHLETIAVVAQRHKDLDLELRALRRLAADHADDAGVRLRLADALRRAGRFDESETLYREILARSR